MITASLVTYHTKISEFLRLLECVKNSSISILYIIDNSSNDMLRNYVESSKRFIYIHSENLGFGHGHNIGIKLATQTASEYHIIINPDIYWDGDIVGSLKEFMERNTDCGNVMPKILYPNGDVQYLCKLLPTPLNLIVRRFIPIRIIKDKIDRKFELHDSNYDKVMEVPYLSGCFMFIRTDILREIGGFDERFFMYAEDVDLCRRIGEVSKTLFYPFVSVYHEYGKGSYKNKKLLKYHLLSIIKYFCKWGWFFDSYRKKTNIKCLKSLKFK